MDRDPVLTLAVNRMPGHDGWKKLRILSSIRDEQDLPEALRFTDGRRHRPTGVAPQDAALLLKTARTELRQLERARIGYHLLGDPGYPASLALIADPPLVLYYRGSPCFAGRPGIGIVGTRRPAPDGLRQAYRIALEFALSGYPVVSGLAFGIDRAAHEGALAGDGPTWAVLAGGLDRPSPFSHRPLAHRILDRGGALVGEIQPGLYPLRYAFPRRNRILSGLCRGCIVVQAPEKSGALITAEYALDQNRDLYVASSGLDGPASAGTRDLERQGAPVIRSAAEVLADWGRFLDIRSVKTLTPPESGEDLVRMMKGELNGQLSRYMGGWFEHRGA